MRSAAKSLGGWADELDPPKVDPNFESVTLRAIFDDIGVTRSPLVDQDAVERMLVTRIGGIREIRDRADPDLPPPPLTEACICGGGFYWGEMRCPRCGQHPPLGDAIAR